MSYIAQIENNIHGGKYNWRFQSVAQELLQAEGKCQVCGSKQDLEVHHIVHGKVYDKSYTNPSNIIVLCRDCHTRYHRAYDTVNAKTFIEFVKRRNHSTLQSKVNKLTHENKLLQKRVDLRM
ncbi:MAG: HNH endonuclease [Methanobrevibacter sp.]|nr:HNH endonuclease [Methanosphaera sp.]MBR0369124.1 HNH endonuclease [Methanobrevibacter sp.]